MTADGAGKVVEMQKVFQSSGAQVHLLGKNQAVNKLVSVFIPAALGLTAVALLVDGAHKIYTGKGKLE